MDNLTIAAASGLRARLESLDLLAHNLANASTAGFKADREVYRQFLTEVAAEGSDPSIVPVVESRWTDFTQAVTTPTGRPTDFALNGRGFFVAKGPDGPVYTRDGSFQLSRDGRLLTREGYEVEVRTPDQRPFRADPVLALEVAPDGAVRQGGEILGTLRVVEFDNAVANEKRAGNYFSFSSPQPIEARNVEIQQGRLEQSNVAPAEMAVRLVNVMRQFEMLNRAVALGGEMNQRAIEEVARVSS
jgi:flagellar basal-body rod protein FlgF